MIKSLNKNASMKKLVLQDLEQVEGGMLQEKY